MKLLLIFFTAFFAVVIADEEVCYQSAQRFCSPVGGGLSCDAKYGAIDEVVDDLQKFVNKHISTSFQYLLMSTHFGNFEKERAGFQKLFRKYSDEKWNDAIELIKHITKRGGQMDFNNHDPIDTKRTYEISEMESLAKALDTEKVLANEALHIHGEVTRKRDGLHDPEIGNYLEEEFMEKHAENVRALSGYSNDLSKLLNTDSQDNSLSMYMFDEYLSKHI